MSIDLDALEKLADDPGIWLMEHRVRRENLVILAFCNEVLSQAQELRIQRLNDRVFHGGRCLTPNNGSILPEVSLEEVEEAVDQELNRRSRPLLDAFLARNRKGEGEG